MVLATSRRFEHGGADNSLLLGHFSQGLWRLSLHLRLLRSLHSPLGFVVPHPFMLVYLEPNSNDTMLCTKHVSQRPGGARSSTPRPLYFQFKLRQSHLHERILLENERA